MAALASNGADLLSDAERAVFAIADRGPGIPINERKNVLRRFYRLERSRNSAGNGLGLSLVAAWFSCTTHK
jgi:signal transduction histidine kinase